MIAAAVVCANGGMAASAADAPPAPNASNVSSVVVTAQKRRDQVLLDRRVYNVDRDIQSTTGTAADVLNQIPSVEVDADGAVSLRGDSNVVILIDGKPSTRLTGSAAGVGLTAFAASDIARIEVLTNPPAQYKAEGAAGVINIVTKKARKPGFSGIAQVNVGNDRRYNANLTTQYSRDKLRLSAGLNLRQDDRLRQIDDSRTATDPQTQQPSADQERLREHVLRLSPEVKLGLDYDIDKTRSFGVSTTHHELTGDRVFDQFDQSGPLGSPFTAASLRHSDGHEWNQDLDEEAHFEQKLSRPDETLTAAAHHSVTRERERYSYLNTYSLPPSAASADHLHLSQDLTIDEFSLDYTLPLSADQDLKLGYDLEIDANHFDQAGDNVDTATGALIDNAAITNHFRYRQKINSLYGNLDLTAGKWQGQFGLRLEQTDVSSRQIIGAIANSQRYLRAYPSLHLSRAITKDLSLVIAASRRIVRPDPEALDPLVDYQDVHNLRAGNPRLLPQDTQSFEVGFNYSAAKFSYDTTLYYRFNRNSVTDITQVLSADVLLSTKENIPKSRSAGLEFSVEGPLTRQLSVGASGNLFYLDISAPVLGASGLRSTVGLNLKANLDYHPTRVDTAQLFFSRSDKRLTPQGYIEAINLLNLGYRRQLRPDLGLVATVSDVLNGQRFQRYIAAPGLQDRYQRYQSGQIAYVGIQYTFGGGKHKAAAFEYDKP